MPTRRNTLAHSTALVLAGLALGWMPLAAQAADYAVDNNAAQNVGNLPASPNGGWITVGDINPGQSLTIASCLLYTSPSPRD